VPDLATSWSWNEEGIELTFPLRQGVRWHDGKPFTAKDVKCTWDMLAGKSSDKLRLNPRKAWYNNLEEITANSDYQVTFRLKRPQPAFVALLASGFSPVYPCHVPPRDMRTHPIGTGPFKFVEFKPNELIRVTRNPDYWKEGREALSRRHRVYDHPEPVDGDPGIHRREIRPDLPVQRDDATVEGRQKSGA
jgi:peptide/nickel transport system substrate-binding protein